MRCASVRYRSAAVLLGIALIGGAFATWLADPARAASSVPALRLTRVGNLANPTAMAVRSGDTSLYVTLQGGQVRAIRRGKVVAQPVLDLTDRVSQDGGERGLLGIVFSPDGSLLYVDYTDTTGNVQVDELAVRGTVVDPSTRRTVVTVDHPAPNHNGGQLAFGPDGDLYIGVGDGGGEGDTGPGHEPGGNGQALDTLDGKILRIDPHPTAAAAYTVPPDNPFVGVAGARPEIWAYGLRNPWRFSFAPAGDLWIADVGQDEWEEIDHVRATAGRNAGRGVNFGWSRLEGDHPYRGSAPNGADLPVYEVSHDTGACAIIGGFVYRGKQIRALRGDYLFSDACDGTIRVLVSGGGGVDDVTMEATNVKSSQVSSFGQDADGRLYVLSLATGVFRIDPAAS
jgi:glucose/arabinose dehydrogenase